MGLLANDGNGHDDLFGDNENYTTYDRVLFATRPIAIAQKIMGQEDSEIPLFIAVAYDRLVDDPLATYRGDCRGGHRSPEKLASRLAVTKMATASPMTSMLPTRADKQATGTTFGGPIQKTMSLKWSTSSCTEARTSSSSGEKGRPHCW